MYLGGIIFEDSDSYVTQSILILAISAKNLD